MGTSRSPDRIRGFAAILGIGTALSAGCGIAAADPGAPDSSTKSDTTTSGPARPTRGSTSDDRTARTPRPPAIASATASVTASADRRTSAPDATAPDAPSRGRPAAVRIPAIPDFTEPLAEPFAEPVAAKTALPTQTPSAAPAASASVAVPMAASAAVSASTNTPVPTPIPAPTPHPANSMSSASPPIASAIGSANPVTTASVVGLALTNIAQFAMLLTVSALSAAPPGPFTAVPTLRLNGFDFVPTATEEITSVYGRWAYMPGTPGLIQGRQKFSVVDPETGDEVGTFDALVGRGNGIGYTQLLVTSTESAPTGPVPPVGSMISNLQFGPIGFSYSALPTPSGKNAVSFKITTPFGNIPVPIPFDYAKGIADRTVDNRPMQLGNGYSIAPTDPFGETLTAITGVLPGFMTVQGHQSFSVYDSDSNPVGSFEGVFTTTADLFFYTQALLVTANDGTNVGTGPGQVPPVGSVYNVIYLGTDDHFFLYSSLPDAGGDKVSVIRVNKTKVTTSAITLINASRPPATTTLSGAGGFQFIPVSALQPSGINGLPPREVEIQGYQQFDVVDSAGVTIGTVDADVFTQWDGFGIHSTALLITNIRQGGSDVPPPGSIFNFVNSGNSGFGSAHSTVVWPSGNLTSFKLVTPFGDIPLPATQRPTTDRTPVTFYNPS